MSITNREDAEAQRECQLIGELLKEGLSMVKNYSGKVFRGDIMSDEEMEMIRSGVYQVDQLTTKR